MSRKGMTQNSKPEERAKEFKHCLPGQPGAIYFDALMSDNGDSKTLHLDCSGGDSPYGHIHLKQLKEFSDFIKRAIEWIGEDT